jgi:hypothetical protein
MKSIVCVAIVLAIVGFINAQIPPLAVFSCVVPTGLNFCGSVVTYPVVSSTTWALNDTAAQGYFNMTVASLPNASPGCQAALQTFYCQSSFPRCNNYTVYSGVAASRCNAVNSQCNITGFPSGHSGTPCINNNFVSVDSSATCAGTSGTSLGQSCVANPFNPSLSLSSFQFVTCPLNTVCNTTQTNPTCVKPNNLGDACPTGVCYNGFLMGTTSLSCISGTCQYYGKRFGYQCTTNAECLSNNCTAGTCWESSLGGYCSNSNQCRSNLYCDLYNQTCYSVAQVGEYCGIVYSNWSPVPCATGYTCVSGNQTLATCQPNAQLGATCSVNTGAIAYNNPLCISSNVTSNYQCINNVCTNVVPQQGGQVCNSTLTCDPSLTCQYSGSSSQGVCTSPSSVQCSSFGPQCNTNQYCNCGSGGMGTCAITSLSIAGSCGTQLTSLASCLFSNCGSATAPFIFYDQYSCGSQSCSAQVNALVCCAQGTQGSNWVPPNGTPSNVCGNPSPTPTPTQTTTLIPTQTTTSTPTQTSVPTNTPVPTNPPVISVTTGTLTSSISGNASAIPPPVANNSLVLYSSSAVNVTLPITFANSPVIPKAAIVQNASISFKVTYLAAAVEI